MGIWITFRVWWALITYLVRYLISLPHKAEYLIYLNPFQKLFSRGFHFEDICKVQRLVRDEFIVIYCSYWY